MVLLAEEREDVLDLVQALLVARVAVDAVVVEAVDGEIDDVDAAAVLGQLGHQAAAAHGLVVRVRREDDGGFRAG